jgi:dTMP kinase
MKGDRWISEVTERKALFIAFEGGEGAGKTTQAQLLQERLRGLGREVLLTREPGGTDVGERLREIILRPSKMSSGPSAAPPQSKLTAAAELFLFLAARAQLVSEVIRPALADGTVVVCDRFSDSTIAYQGYGRGLYIEAVRRACELATGGLRPDLSVLLDLPVETGLARQSEGGEWDAIGQESREFHMRVRRGFHELAAAEPQRWLVVDAAQPVEEVARVIWERIRGLLDRTAL